MTDDKKCKWKDCNNRILKGSKRKFCDHLCAMKYFNYVPGKPIYSGICECGCEGYWCSTKSPQKYIKEHENGFPKPKKPGWCKGCIENANFEIPQNGFKLKVCVACYIRIIEMRNDRIILKCEGL